MKKVNSEIYHFWMAREGGQSQRGVLALLRAKKIECRAAYSHLVGHTAVEVFGGKRAQSAAEKIIYG